MDFCFQTLIIRENHHKKTHTTVKDHELWLLENQVLQQLVVSVHAGQQHLTLSIFLASAGMHFETPAFNLCAIVAKNGEAALG